MLDSSIDDVELGETNIVEIMGQVLGVDDVPPFITGFVQRLMGADFDLTTFKQMILLTHDERFRHLF